MASQSNSTSANLYGQTSMLIINALLQMIEIIDEYFDISTSRRIMRSAVQVVIQKYITVLLLRGDTVRS